MRAKNITLTIGEYTLMVGLLHSTLSTIVECLAPIGTYEKDEYENPQRRVKLGIESIIDMLENKGEGET